MDKKNTGSVLKYRIREPLKKSNNTPTIFLLHGFGSNMDDLFSLNQFFFSFIDDTDSKNPFLFSSSFNFEKLVLSRAF